MYRPPHLTRREIEIVPFLVSGATRTEMAHHFNISEETINTHVRNLLRKFGAASLRDCIFDITQYNEQFIEGLHEFYVPRLETTVRLKPNYMDCDIISNFDLLAMKAGVNHLTELYASDGDLPTVKINGTQIDPVQELSGYSFTLDFPKALGDYEEIQVSTEVTLANAFGKKNIESHFNSIADPTGHLKLGIEFQTERLPEKVSFLSRHGVSAYKEIKTILHPEHRFISIDIDRPEYLRKYYIRWEWSA